MLLILFVKAQIIKCYHMFIDYIKEWLYGSVLAKKDTYHIVIKQRFFVARKKKKKNF